MNDQRCHNAIHFSYNRLNCWDRHSAINDQIFTTTSSSQEETTTPNEPEKQTSGLFILALGDLLTRGTGDTTGQGYVR